MAAGPVAAGGSRDRACRRAEAAGLRSLGEPGELVPRLWAYCGVTASGKSLYAVVAQVAARKPVLAKKLGGFDAGEPCRSGLRRGGVAAGAAADHVSPGGKDAVSFDIAPGSAVLVEDRRTSRERRRQGEVAGQRVGESASQLSSSWKVSHPFADQVCEWYSGSRDVPEPLTGQNGRIGHSDDWAGQRSLWNRLMRFW